ncbi:MAG: HepT-like ribonuclease domain-containing protein [Alphaproteobacteria bacterium]|nr:HepT-like ribonuclease domain-containing protein [Alphaproteobacteria bacterium]
MIPSVADRLRHILDAIEHIDVFLQDGLNVQNEMQASAIFFKLIVIGEACSHIPSSFRKEFSDIPWAGMLGLRNVLAHEYFQLEAERIRHAIATLPQIKARIVEVIDKITRA